MTIGPDAHSAAHLYAYLGYRDVPAAIDWLAAVGFDVVARQEEPDGTVVHAEVRRGGVVVMLATDDRPYTPPALRDDSTGSGLYLLLGDAALVEDWYRRAVVAGARGVIPPETTPWGAVRARVLDPEGHEWSAGTYKPGGGRASGPPPVRRAADRVTAPPVRRGSGRV